MFNQNTKWKENKAMNLTFTKTKGLTQLAMDAEMSTLLF